MRRKYAPFLIEWIVFTMMSFFLYDIIWALVDIEYFKQVLKEHPFWILVDFIYCSLFSLSSILISSQIFKLKDPRGRKTWHYTNFARDAALIVASNLIVAVGCEFLITFLDPTFLSDDPWGSSFLFCIIASLVAVIHLSLHYADMVEQRSIENVRLQKKYLKMQLDPHFVFNNLGSLAGMIVVNPKMAEDYVVKLAHVYRHVLNHIEKNYISLNEACQYTRAHIEMLNVRYRGTINLKTDPSMNRNDEYVLSLSLQLLVENAVKHNIPQETNMLCIEIYTQDGMMVVKNNRIHAGKYADVRSVESYGIGIKNLCMRYRLEGDRQPEFLVTENSFEVKLPIFRNIYEKGIDN